VTRYHLDTDFLVKAIGLPGEEREQLRRLQKTSAEIEMSAIGWYEFCRGPRAPEVEAIAREALSAVIPFGEDLALTAADLFRRLGGPRKRAADLAIAATALARGARLLTANTRDFSGIDGLLLGPG
jgi:predicted nucleic acid-binding protein